MRAGFTYALSNGFGVVRGPRSGRCGREPLATELGSNPHDILITKHRWGAFTGTDRDDQLRRRGICHEHSIARIFPRLGETTSAAVIQAALEENAPH